MQSYFLNIETTLLNGEGELIIISGIGPFEHESARSMWVRRFWVLLDDLNDELGLPSTTTDAIGANLEDIDNPLHRPRAMRPWTVRDVVAEIKRLHEKYSLARAT
jgi:hypothetical protein